MLSLCNKFTALRSTALLVLLGACSAPTMDAGLDLAAPAGPDQGALAGDLASAAADLGPAAPDLSRFYATDRATFFGASRCAGAGLQLCEDFESGALDANTWTVIGTKPVIDGVQRARGAKALHITVTGNGGSSLRETRTFPALNNTYWGRAFYYFESMPAMPMASAHWTLVAATGTGVSGEIRVGGHLLGSGVNRFGVGTDNRVDPTGTGDWTRFDNDPTGKPLPVPLRQWVCLEWLHQGETNETRFFWDGVEHISMHTTDFDHGGNLNAYVLPKFTTLTIGWQEYQAATDKFELWVDEIAIDKQRVGCDR